MIPSIMIYPLSGLIGNSFEATRMSAANMGGTISSAALVLGCFFFGLRMIKMYYDIVSDEQHGGFGGIRVMDVLRPILVLLLIAGYSQVVIRPVDSLASISCNIIGGANVSSFSAGMGKLKNTLSDAKTAAEIARGERDGVENGNPPAAEGDGATASLGFSNGGGNIVDRIKDFFKGVTSFYDQIGIWTKGLVAGTAKACGTVIDAVLIWIFNIMATVMRIFADIMLNILVMVGPLMLAFSVFDRWKGYAFTFIGQYIQFSLWKPIVGLILWATMSANDAVGNVLAVSFGASDSTFVNMVGAVIGAIGQTAIIVFAGIQTLKQVPAIANTLISLASGLSTQINTGGALGAAAGVVGGAAGATLGTVGRAGGYVVGSVAGGLGGMAQGYMRGGVKGAMSMGGQMASKVGQAASSGIAGAGKAAGSALGKVGKTMGNMF